MESVMSKSRSLGKATAAATMMLLASQAAADVIYDDGKAYLTDVSGLRGEPVSIAGNISAPYRAITSIKWDEKSNRPCYFEVEGTHMNTKSVERYTVNRCGSSGQPTTVLGTTSGVNTVWTNKSYGIYISGIRVCMNDQDTRVKGMEVRASVVEGDRVVAYEDWMQPAQSSSPIGGPVEYRGRSTHVSVPAQNPNCNGNWKRWVDCRAGELPSAVYLHFSGAATPSSLTGVSLACRRVLQKG
jgi:hypothetical protein